VEFGDDDLTNFNAEKNKLIKEKNMTVSGSDAQKGDEAELLKSLFVTQVDDAFDDFEKDKDKEVANQIGKSVVRSTIKQGWGSWAGNGVDNSKQEA